MEAAQLGEEGAGGPPVHGRSPLTSSTNSSSSSAQMGLKREIGVLIHENPGLVWGSVLVPHFSVQPLDPLAEYTGGVRVLCG